MIISWSHILLKWNKLFFELCQRNKTHFLWDCDLINCTTYWEQLCKSAPKTELMQYVSYRRPKLSRRKFFWWPPNVKQHGSDSGCENEKLDKKGEKRKSVSWELFDCLPWPSYRLAITPSIISQLHQHSKPDQQGGGHKMTSTHQSLLVEQHCNIFHLAYRWCEMLWCRLISAQTDYHSWSVTA